MDITKCPAHPNSSGTSNYGGMWCWGEDKTCKWAVKEFVNDTEDGGVEKVTKYHLPQPGRWLSKEDYISEVVQLDDAFPPDAPSDAPEALDRQTSIVRQTSIKCAAMALQHATGTAEEKAGAITYLAGVLEDWCNR